MTVPTRPTTSTRTLQRALMLGMMQDVRSIPPAPRRIRLRPLLAHRWPLLAAGSWLGVIGTLVGWLMFLQIGGKFSDTARLDRARSQDLLATVSGTVVAVGTAFEDGGRSWHWVRYEFPWLPHGQAVRMNGESFVAGSPPAIGAAVDVEVLPEEANKNRLRAGVLLMDRDYLHPRFWFTVVVAPGAVLLLTWLVGAFRLRHVLVHGDVSVGHVIATAPVPLVLPQMLVVEYRFRDHRAIARRGRHWVRVHGMLGARLLRQDGLTGIEPLPVLHDRLQPDQNRLLLPQDFLPEPANPKDAWTENGVS